MQAKIASFDISHRPWPEQIEPLLWAACSIVSFVSIFSSRQHDPLWFALLLGIGFAVLFCWNAIHLWGWRLEVKPDGLRIRRRYRWTKIGWEQINFVDSHPSKSGRPAQESVVLKLAPHSSEQLGTFGCVFARNLRDRLRYELAQRV